MKMLWNKTVICSGSQIKKPHEVLGRHNPDKNVVEWRKGRSVDFPQRYWEKKIEGNRWWENGQVNYRKPTWPQYSFYTT